jgi:hypothetical protein
MRTIVVLASLCLATVAALPASARAEQFCGFKDIKGSLVRCGYVSVTECKEKNGGKDAVCIPDPAFAAWQRGRLPG